MLTKRNEDLQDIIPTPTLWATPPGRGISSLHFLRIFSIIKVEKRFVDRGLRSLAGNPLPAFEAKIVGGQRTKVQQCFYPSQPQKPIKYKRSLTSLFVQKLRREKETNTPVIRNSQFVILPYFINTTSPKPSSFILGNCVFASPATNQIILFGSRYFLPSSLMRATVISFTICSLSFT